jgi:hypothetical protein
MHALGPEPLTVVDRIRATTVREWFRDKREWFRDRREWFRDKWEWFRDRREWFGDRTDSCSRCTTP